MSSYLDSFLDKSGKSKKESLHYDTMTHTLPSYDPEPPKFDYLNTLNRNRDPEPEPPVNNYLNLFNKSYDPEPPKFDYLNSVSKSFKSTYESLSYEPPYYSSKIVSRYEPKTIEIETPKLDIFDTYKAPKIEFPKYESRTSEILKPFHAPTIDDKINNAWTSKLLGEAGEIALSTTTHIMQRSLSAFASGATKCLITAGGLIRHVATDFVIGLPSRMLDYAIPHRYRDTGRADVAKGIVTGIVTGLVTMNPIAAIIPVAIGIFRSLFRKRW